MGDVMSGHFAWSASQSSKSDVRMLWVWWFLFFVRSRNSYYLSYNSSNFLHVSGSCDVAVMFICTNFIDESFLSEFTKCSPPPPWAPLWKPPFEASEGSPGTPPPVSPGTPLPSPSHHLRPASCLLCALCHRLSVRESLAIHQAHFSPRSGSHDCEGNVQNGPCVTNPSNKRKSTDTHLSTHWRCCNNSGWCSRHQDTCWVPCRTAKCWLADWCSNVLLHDPNEPRGRRKNENRMQMTNTFPPPMPRDEVHGHCMLPFSFKGTGACSHGDVTLERIGSVGHPMLTLPTARLSLLTIPSNVRQHDTMWSDLTCGGGGTTQGKFWWCASASTQRWVPRTWPITTPWSWPTATARMQGPHFLLELVLDLVPLQFSTRFWRPDMRTTSANTKTDGFDFGKCDVHVSNTVLFHKSLTEKSSPAAPFQQFQRNVTRSLLMNHFTPRTHNMRIPHVCHQQHIPARWLETHACLTFGTKLSTQALKNSSKDVVRSFKDGCDRCWPLACRVGDSAACKRCGSWSEILCNTSEGNLHLVIHNDEHSQTTRAHTQYLIANETGEHASIVMLWCTSACAHAWLRSPSRKFESQTQRADIWMLATTPHANIPVMTPLNLHCPWGHGIDDLFPIVCGLTTAIMTRFAQIVITLGGTLKMGRACWCRELHTSLMLQLLVDTLRQQFLCSAGHR